MTLESSQFACPLPLSAAGEHITLAHGEGGRLTRMLIAERLLPTLGNTMLATLGDAAGLPGIAGPLAFTTDSFVVSPLFFPGGDIGTLAVYGTVNDLVVSGARPRWLSLSLIIEEGLAFSVLDRIIRSIADAAKIAKVEIVTGDTKVVPRGAADKIFINTSGIGELLEPIPAGPAALQVGDDLIVTGPIGRHGISIMACREQLGFEPPPRSDCAPLTAAANLLREIGCPVRAMRDATRGGVSAVLHEWALQSSQTMSIDEASIPVSADVRGACELLGLDPLHVPNEGTMVVAVPAGWGARTVTMLRTLDLGAGATVIGKVAPRRIDPVIVRRIMGTDQPLDEPLGSPLPRIC